MRWWTIPLMSLLACGAAVDEEPAGGTGGGSMGAGAETAASSGATSAGTPITATSTTTGAGSTNGPVTADPSTVTSGSSTDGDTGTGASAEGSTGSAACADDADYSAAPLIGALDRVQIFRRDAAGQCIVLTIVSPGVFSDYDVDVNLSWALERALVSDGASDCDQDAVWMERFSPIPDAEGTITLTTGPSDAPCGVTVDVTLQLLADPDPPIFVEFCHPELIVDGCEV